MSIGAALTCGALTWLTLVVGSPLALSRGQLPGLTFAAGPEEASGPAAVDYLRDIKPLLARHCVACHGVEKPRGNLRLDTAAAALAGGDLGPSVVPGAPDESELLLAVTGDEPVLSREILLRGVERPYMYAHSWLVPSRLPQGMQNAMLQTDTPIGQLWRAAKLDPLRRCSRQRRIWRRMRLPASSDSAGLNPKKYSPVLVRTLRERNV